MPRTPTRPGIPQPATPLLPSDDESISPTEAEAIAAAADQEEEEVESEEDLDPFSDTDPLLPHLRNINSLASWTVSTSKPSCSIPALLAPNPLTFWQSDGPQPHTLTIHFFKRVHIVKLRLLLDWKRDESYTPTRMQFWAGTGLHDLCMFGEWEGERPRGWVDVLRVRGRSDGLGVGGGEDGGEEEDRREEGVWCFLVEVRVLENHQNGKDTHVRGVQVFARDERGMRKMVREVESESEEDEEMEVEDTVGVKGRKSPVKKGVDLWDLEWPGGMEDPVVR